MCHSAAGTAYRKVEALKRYIVEAFSEGRASARPTLLTPQVMEISQWCKPPDLNAVLSPGRAIQLRGHFHRPFRGVLLLFA